MKKTYHFLGSIYFAVILIGSVAAFAIAGTFIESLTDSHRYAALFTYQNPVFTLLLWGFFVNILFSALRRWPFKMRHIPFLITHCGLLMILSGCLVKSYLGTQGVMTVVEGSGSQTIFLPDTYSVSIEKKGVGSIGEYDPMSGISLFDDLEISCVDYCPNSLERIETWIKGEHVFISGLAPFPLDKPMKVQLFPDPSPLWTVLGKNSYNVIADAQKEYLEGLQVILHDRATGEILYEGALKEIENTLHFNYSDILGFDQPKLQVEDVSLALDGEDALVNTSYLGNSSIRVTLSREPKLLILKDPLDEVTLFSFGPHGDMHSERYQTENLPSLIAYDGGFGGYSVLAKLTYQNSLEERGKVVREILIQEIRAGEISTLSPPLKLFWETCEKTGVDFAETCVDFFYAWDNTHSWLFPNRAPLSPKLAEVMNNIDWEPVPLAIKKGAAWTCHLFDEIEPKLQKGEAIEQVLRDRGCPIPNEKDLLTGVTQQIFAAGDLLPDGDTPDSARLFSAYLRAYGIHLNSITPQLDMSSEEIALESPLTLLNKKLPPGRKLEENLPKITLQLKKGSQIEYVTLTYHKIGSGLKWPALNGEYLFRFQPKTQQIPYRVRLRNARQISYANSGQAFSYESDLIVTDLETGTTAEPTISMNQVHETWDGHRFYLSSISPPNETAVKRIQLVVNHDPGKYLLTYPGGLIVALGSILLFGRIRRTRNK